jgi:putative transposase
MLNSGKDLAAILQNLEGSEATYHRWRTQYDGMKSDEANPLRKKEIENARLKRLLTGGIWPRRCSRSRCGETTKPDKEKRDGV